MVQGFCKGVGESGGFRNIKVSEKNNMNFADVTVLQDISCVFIEQYI